MIKLGEQRAESKCTLVYGQMNEPPGARARVALTGEGLTWGTCARGEGGGMLFGEGGRQARAGACV